MIIKNAELKQALRLVDCVPADSGVATSECVQLTVAKGKMRMCIAGRASVWATVAAEDTKDGVFCVSRRHLGAVVSAAESSGIPTSKWSLGAKQLVVSLKQQTFRLANIVEAAVYPEPVPRKGRKFGGDAVVLQDLTMLAAFTRSLADDVDAVVLRSDVAVATDHVHLAVVRWPQPLLEDKTPIVLDPLVIQAAGREERGSLLVDKTGAGLLVGYGWLYCPARTGYPLAAVTAILKSTQGAKLAVQLPAGELKTHLDVLSSFAFDAPENVADVLINKSDIVLRLPLQSGDAKTVISCKTKKAFEGRWALNGLGRWVDYVALIVGEDATVDVLLGEKMWVFRTSQDGKEYMLLVAQL